MMNQGAKIAVIAIIWGFGTAMFALCIPLVKITQSGIILPIILVISICFSTVTVWKFQAFDD
jgi:hypothetical protein